ncbi:hypothetical protein ABT297_26930 [Dactylosporangium sp. NPDC000555]|uniref:hypothetical protein n=1 Tax=Dactylosporangium sp. NPDC000555 TaxID=3154260 RepID=UPI003322BBC2
MDLLGPVIRFGGETLSGNSIFAFPRERLLTVAGALARGDAAVPITLRYRLSTLHK